jgi:hypothetical protein
MKTNGVEKPLLTLRESNTSFSAVHPVVRRYTDRDISVHHQMPKIRIGFKVGQITFEYRDPNL